MDAPNSPRDKQRLPTPDGASCSICLETVESAGKRSVARLKCSHVFHLDCIGSAFNAKGAMQCPNCRQVEGGQWLYSSGNLMQQDSFERNDYARLLFEVAYLQNENEGHEESIDNTLRWPSRLYRHHVNLQGEEDDSPINSRSFTRADERQLQGVQRYQSSGAYIPSISGLDLRHAAPAIELTRQTAHPIEVERLLRQDLQRSRGSAAYEQSLQPRSYDRSNVNLLPELYSSHMLERSGYEEHSLYPLLRPAGGRIHRGLSNMGVAFSPPHTHVLRNFGLQGWISSLEQSNLNRFEAARYGHFTRADGVYSSHVSSGRQDLASRSLGHGYDAQNFDNHGAFWMGTRIPPL